MTDLSFDPSRKKVKKPAKAALPTDLPTDADAAVVQPVLAGLDDLTFDPKKAKPAKQVTITTPLDEITQNQASTVAPGRDIAGPEGAIYTYEFLLKRVYDIMDSKNKDKQSGKSDKTLIIQPPSVDRAGSKKTAFYNFKAICQAMKRQERHVLQFITTEFGTSGNMDGSDQLILKGKFNQKQVEKVLRKYILEYVTCHTCRSSKTTLIREDRLMMMQCHSCESKCSVTTIKAGFSAQTSKRKFQKK